MSAQDVLTVTLGHDVREVVKPRAFLTLLQMCTVFTGAVRGMLSCNDVAFWRQIYTHLIATPFSQQAIFRLLSSPPERGASAAVYKRRCIELVVYRILDDQAGMPPVDMHLLDRMQKFIARKNGSIEQVKDGVRTWARKVRERDPHFPPMPAEFVVALVGAAKKIVLAWRGNKPAQGLVNVPLLLDSLKEEEFW